MLRTRTIYEMEALAMTDPDFLYELKNNYLPQGWEPFAGDSKILWFRRVVRVEPIVDPVT